MFLVNRCTIRGKCCMGHMSSLLMLALFLPLHCQGHILRLRVSFFRMN